MTSFERMIALFVANRPLGAATVLFGALVGALLMDILLRKVFLKLARKTKTTLDDAMISAARKPIFYSILFVGLYYSCRMIGLSEAGLQLTGRVLVTLAVLLWTGALMKSAKLLLDAAAARSGDQRIVQNRTLPIFDILLKFIIIGGALYIIFLTWNVDVTAWLASAGIVGIAVGFAAKDTLANFFSGIFILADAPYKIGDFIVLDSGERGQVTEIGIRSTRILTRDDIQIIIPNASIGAAKIINETGGPHPKRRVAAHVGVSYDSDIDKVRNVLMEIAADCDLVVADPEPRVRFRSFGDSALNFDLLCWIKEPVDKGRAIDILNSEIFKRFRQNAIQIPFPQRDIHIKNQ